MSRYLGPIYKKSRRWNFSLLENNKEFRRKRGGNQRATWKTRKTAFGLQLEEKQKLRFLYQISEKQLRNTFKKILKMKGIKSDNLFIQLEKRLDNIVYRMGLATTRSQARQMVNHGHILVNNKKNNIPSFILVKDDIVAIKKPKIRKKVQEILKNNKLEKSLPFSFLHWDDVNIMGKLVAEPNLTEVNPGINGALVVEYYNRFI